MTMGKFDPHAVNFVVRDIDTGEVYEEFRKRASSINYLRTMNFGLAVYYEVFDVKENKIICRVEKYGDNNYTNIKEDIKKKK